MHTTIASTKRKTQIWVGPNDDGKRMPLTLFARAQAVPGYRYELSNGVVQVTDIPGMTHNFTVDEIDRLLRIFQIKNSGVITYFGGGDRAKMELWNRGSERHPDLSVYLSSPPKGVEQPWDRWIPEIAIEVVSASSARRDYEEKPDDYLAAGVREYWIIDPIKKSGLFLTRRGDGWIEKRVGRRGIWTTPLLPKFKLDLAKLFERVAKHR